MTDMRPRYTKRDANQSEIVADLRGLGYLVVDFADTWILDILVCGHIGGGEWHWLAVEIKTPGGRLTDNQKRFFEMWPDVPAIVAQATEDVLAWYSWAGNRDVEYKVCGPECDAYESCGGPTLCLKDEEATCS